jgi:hypothetical protein
MIGFVDPRFTRGGSARSFGSGRREDAHVPRAEVHRRARRAGVIADFLGHAERPEARRRRPGTSAPTVMAARPADATQSRHVRTSGERCEGGEWRLMI